MLVNNLLVLSAYFFDFTCCLLLLLVVSYVLCPMLYLPPLDPGLLTGSESFSDERLPSPIWRKLNSMMMRQGDKTPSRTAKKASFGTIFSEALSKKK